MMATMPASTVLAEGLPPTISPEGTFLSDKSVFGSVRLKEELCSALTPHGTDGRERAASVPIQHIRGWDI